MLYLDLPQNNYELTGYIVAAAFALLVRIVLGIVVDWSSLYQRQFVWGVTLLVFAFSVWAVWFLNREDSPPEIVPCGYDKAVEVYLKKRSKAISQVERWSDAWYKLSALENFENENMPCEVKGSELERQQQLLATFMKKYNLQ